MCVWGAGGSYQPSQKVLWSKQFGEPPVPSHLAQSFWPHVYELHLVFRVQVRVKPSISAPQGAGGHRQAPARCRRATGQTVGPRNLQTKRLGQAAAPVEAACSTSVQVVARRAAGAETVRTGVVVTPRGTVGARDHGIADRAGAAASRIVSARVCHEHTRASGHGGRVVGGAGAGGESNAHIGCTSPRTRRRPRQPPQQGEGERRTACQKSRRARRALGSGHLNEVAFVVRTVPPVQLPCRRDRRQPPCRRAPSSGCSTRRRRRCWRAWSASRSAAEPLSSYQALCVLRRLRCPPPPKRRQQRQVRRSWWKEASSAARDGHRATRTRRDRWP